MFFGRFYEPKDLQATLGGHGGIGFSLPWKCKLDGEPGLESFDVLGRCGLCILMICLDILGLVG